eukprot:443547_1
MLSEETNDICCDDANELKQIELMELEPAATAEEPDECHYTSSSDHDLNAMDISISSEQSKKKSVSKRIMKEPVAPTAISVDDIYLPTPRMSSISPTMSVDITYKAAKMRELFKNKYFYNRMLVLLLSLIIFILSLFYCIGQILNIRLNLITLCDEEKDIVDIYKFNAGRIGTKIKTNKIINELPPSSCQSTLNVNINEDTLWNENNIGYEWIDYNWQFVLFLILCTYSIIITIYGIQSLVRDIIAFKKNVLHQKSLQYKNTQKK